VADFNMSIDIRYNSDNWGPFNFDLSNAIPTGDSLISATVRSFVGPVKPSSNLTDFIEIPNDGSGLIDMTYPPVVLSENIVQVHFRYPGDTYKGNKVTLLFEYTTSAGAENVVYGRYVKIS
jgi:hypothetical protein